MGPKVFVVFLVIISALAQLNYNLEQTNLKALMPSMALPEVPLQSTSTLQPPSTPAPPDNIWIYIAIGVGAGVLLFCQTLCFCLYIRKLKSSTTHRNINNMTLIAPNTETANRYQRTPSRVNINILKPGEQHHTSSLYEYECVKDVTNRPEKKPEPPPTSTLPKRERPPLPLPNDVEGHKSSTLTTLSTQHILQQRGRQVSTVPNNPAGHFSPLPPMPSRSPQTRRLPTPVRTPVLKKRESIRNDRSYKIYESLPDLREFRNTPKPPAAHPPIMFSQPTPMASPNLNRGRMLQHGRDTPSPIIPAKSRMPLPQELSRYDRQKPSFTSSTAYTSPDMPPGVSSHLNYRMIPENESVTNELMEKLRRRANLNTHIATGTSRTPALHKPPILPPPKLKPKPKHMEESSDDEEWTMEEIKQINMYNV